MLKFLGSIAAVAGAVLVSTAVTTQVHADDKSGLSFQDPYVKAPFPGQSVTTGYMSIENASTTSRQLQTLSADWANAIEIHTHVHENGVMKMRRQDTLAVPAEGAVTLKPGGLHLMIFGVEAPLTGPLPITLCFDGDDCMDVDFRLYSPM